MDGPRARQLELRTDAVLGRAGPHGADIGIDDPRLSKRHAQITRSMVGWVVRDLDSTNHTHLDGHELPPNRAALLEDGAVLRVGSTVAVFRAGPPVPETDDPLVPGIAPGIVEARRTLAALAASTEPVLVLGATGTGKERSAAAVHRWSPRCDGPYVTINCAGLHRDLAYTELFGSEAGAFTGALDREGIIASADGGTLLLDEIGDLDLGVQAELLRFLDTGRYRRRGGVEERAVDVRIVAATNVDLADAVVRGAFRRDLYGRLQGGIAAWLPTLAERREDIAAWAYLFLAELVAPRDAPTIAAGAMEALLLHGWRENLRELKGALRLAVARAEDGDTILRKHLPDPVLVARRRARDEEAQLVPASPQTESVEVDRETVEAALRSNAGNIVRTANALGISRRKLYHLRDAYDLELADYRDK